MLINNSKDIIWVKRGVLSKSLICNVNFYIFKSQKVYAGSHFHDSPVSEFVKLHPNDTINSNVYFLLSKDFLSMDDLYVDILPAFSLSLPPYDSISHQTSVTLTKHVLYETAYKFHINTTTKEIKKTGLDIESLIKMKKYEVVKVNFW